MPIDSATNIELEMHVVAFIDLLGFKSAVCNTDSHKDIVQLLRLFMSAVRNAVNYQDSVKGQVMPAVSVFSDHIVISYPATTTADKLRAYHVVSHAIGIAATQAFKYGFLIRGGMTVGILYHKDGVVVGEALIDAVKLESDLAIYPRVILSADIVKFLGTNGYVTIDLDGVHIVDYITKMLLIGTQAQNMKEPNLKELVMNNCNQCEKIITTNKGNYKDNPKIFSKWEWFEIHYNLCKKHMLSVL